MSLVSRVEYGGGMRPRAVFGGDLAREEIKEFQPDEVYYNVRLYNGDQQKIIPAEFRDLRPSPILTDPNDYRMAVVRFSIPQTVPLFNWLASSNDRVSLVHRVSSTTFTVPLVFVGNSPEFPDGSPEGPVWMISQYLIMINNALAAAAALLFAAFPVVGAAPPFVEYDSNVSLFRLYMPTAYETNAGDEIDLYLTFTIARLLGDFTGNNPFSNDYPSATDSPLQFRYRGMDLNTNTVTLSGTTYYRMDGAFDASSRWSDVLFVALDSSDIPIQPELGVPVHDDPTQNQNQVIWSFTDFGLPVHRPTREPIDFAASGSLRWYKLGSPGGNVAPMYSIGIRASYVDRFGVRRPLALVYGDVLDLKILFRRKDLDLS